jgi:uncharacterized protein YndB with AHSA1/START domain
MPDIYHLVFIQTTPEKIFNAISAQEGIASWWSKTNNAKPEEGSVFKIYFGPVYCKEIKITKLIPGKRIEWEVLDAHPEWVKTKIVFDIQVAENNTELRFRHSNWKDYTDMYAQCNHHWGIFLLNLKAYTETGKMFVMNEFGKDIPGGHEK